MALRSKSGHFNIAHILPWPTVGGVECATLRIAEGLNGSEFNSIAFCLPEAVSVVEMFSASEIETVEYRAMEPSYRHSLPFLRHSLGLARELKRKQIGLVHCADMLAAFYGGIAGRLAGIPVLCHIRCTVPYLSRRDQSFLYAVNRFAFVSHDTWKQFGFKVPKRKGSVVYDGIKVGSISSPEETRKSVFCEYGIPESAKVVGMVARVAEAKDYETLAKAAALVIAAVENVRFLIVGDHSGTETYRNYYKKVQRILAEHGVERHFIFTDFQTDVQRFLDAMDIFVLCTHAEGLPLVILEAMARAKPVVATAVGGIPEIVSHQSTGFLHLPGDDQGLAEQILTLLRDEQLASQFGVAGRELVKSQWTEERFIKDMKLLYRKMLTPKNQSVDRRPNSRPQGLIKGYDSDGI